MTSSLPLRFCLGLTHHAWARSQPPRAAVARSIELARIADGAAIDSVWASEDPDGWDAFGLLGALARETERVRLGTGVTNPYLRQPNLIAAAVATLDRLSNGRAFLGLGRGQAEWYERALGIDVGKPVAVLAETVDLLRQWWTPPHRAASDGHFRTRDWERTVHPAQTRVPIYLAAAGPRALALAGRVADGVLFNALTSPDFLARAILEVRAQAAAAGRDPTALAFILRTEVTLADDPAPILERQKNAIALVNALPGMDRLLTTAGFDVPRIMADVRRLMKTDEVLARGGAFPALRRAGDLPAARAAIPTDLVARLAIVGKPDQVRARLRELAAAGITHVFVAPPSPGETSEELAATLDRLRGA